MQRMNALVQGAQRQWSQMQTVQLAPHLTQT